MSLQISEIGVRLAVADPGDASVKTAAAVRAASNNGPSRAMTPAEREELVNECVRVVLLTLNKLEAR